MSDYMKSDTIRVRFAEIVGGDRNAASYIASVLLAIADNEDLQKCTVPSIYISALRAATLRLSVEPGLGQAYIVPFRDHATLIIGYKGLVDMATRTGRYRYINTNKIYEGEEIIEDRITGFVSIGGGKKSNKVVGHLAAFEMINGFAKVIYMTVEEIHAHAEKYSKGYDNPKGLWQKEPEKMERKTVLRILLRKWGYIDPADAYVLDEMQEDEFIDINSYDIPTQPPEEEKEHKSEDQLLAELGFAPAVPEPESEATAAVTEIVGETVVVTETQAKPKKVEPPPADNHSRPYGTGDLRKALDKKSLSYVMKTANKAQRGLLAGILTEAFAPAEDFELRRHAFQKYLFGVESLNDVPDRMILACLNDWLKPIKQTSGEYLADAMAIREIVKVYDEAIVAQGQQELPL
jgi:recombination protein RecT